MVLLLDSVRDWAMTYPINMCRDLLHLWSVFSVAVYIRRFFYLCLVHGLGVNIADGDNNMYMIALQYMVWRGF